MTPQATRLEVNLKNFRHLPDTPVHERPYKRAWPVEEALAEIESERGRQFDPLAVDAFLKTQEMVHAGEDDRSAGG